MQLLVRVLVERFTEGGVVRISPSVTVPLETLCALFEGCESVEDMIERDGGIMGYDEFLNELADSAM